MIEKLDPNDTRPAIIIIKLNEVIEQVNKIYIPEAFEGVETPRAEPKDS